VSSLKSKDLISGASLIPLQRAEENVNASKSVALELKKRDGEIADNARKKAKRAEAPNTLSEVGLLVTTAAAKAALKTNTPDSKRAELLEEQMNARTKGRGSVFTCECIDERFLSSFFKEPTLKLTPDGLNTAAKLTYLTDMMHAKYEKERKRYTSAPLATYYGCQNSVHIFRKTRQNVVNQLRSHRSVR
jgi:hypothetical protein